jgi:Reverse transcriptase (RNA-dependent DNA polymerase)
VACGYSQIPGVDFRDAYSPIINYSSFHLIILIQFIFGLHSRLLDIEVAFLHGELDEEFICIVLPAMTMNWMKSSYYSRPCMVWCKQPDNSSRNQTILQEIYVHHEANQF